MKQADYKHSNMIFESAVLFWGDSVDLSKPDAITKESLKDNMLGLNNGGITLELSDELVTAPILGAGEKGVKDFQRYTSTEGKIEGEVLILDDELIKSCGFTADSSITSTKYTAYKRTEGAIPSDAYHTVIMIGDIGDTQYIVVLKNALNVAGFNLETKSADYAISKVEFQAMYEYPNLNETPVEIFIPKPATTQTQQTETQTP